MQNKEHYLKEWKEAKELPKKDGSIKKFLLYSSLWH